MSLKKVHKSTKSHQVKQSQKNYW